MSIKTHIINIGIEKTSNFQAVIGEIMGNLIKNIEDNKGEFTEFATKQAMYIAKLETKKFTFRGDLERGIVHRVFKKSNRGEIFVKSDQIQKAIMNEYGVTNPENYKGIPYAVKMTSKLKAWAEQKAPKWADKSFVIVGKPGTRSRVIAPTPLNRFWGTTIEIMNKQLPDMFAHYLDKAIEKS